MTELTLRYDDETNRVEQTYWGDENPDWANEQREGTTITTTETTQQSRADALQSAFDDVEAGTDYDDVAERPVGRLCYDPEDGELYGEVDIRPIEAE